MSNCVCWKTYVCLACENKTKVRNPKPKSVSTIRKVAECGTRAGYNKHRREGTPTCAECKAAQSAAVNEYLKRKRAS